MRKHYKYTLTEINNFKKSLLYWASTFDKSCYLDTNSQNNKVDTYDCLVAVGVKEEITPGTDSFNALKEFFERKKDWLFGYFGYDLKNEIENLTSANPDNLGFSACHFFQPLHVLYIQNNILNIETTENISGDELFNEIKNYVYTSQTRSEEIKVKPRITKQEYIVSVDKLKKHIQLGDIYEINFCQEFYAENVVVEAVSVYDKLNSISQAPFSCFYKCNKRYILSASPERFLKKENTKLTSQPIKGTSKRGDTPKQDEELKKNLFNSIKERSENVMIVDLVRNDLAKTAEKGSVKVDELFGIYTFKTVHQMISTISSTLKPSIHFMEVIKHAFPMGSMTGAPKIRAMQLIEETESTKRAVFSSAIGYITPKANFDFNVVIRSILYNQSSQYLSFMVGSAITAQSDVEGEYEECLLKAEALLKALKIN